MPPKEALAKANPLLVEGYPSKKVRDRFLPTVPVTGLGAELHHQLDNADAAGLVRALWHMSPRIRGPSI